MMRAPRYGFSGATLPPTELIPQNFYRRRICRRGHSAQRQLHQQVCGIVPGANPPTVEGGSGNPGYSSQVRACVDFCGMSFNLSTIESAADPPLLIVHGTKDTYIPVTQAVLVAQRARNVGLPFLFYPLRDAIHCPWYFGQPMWSAYLATLVTYTKTFLYPFMECWVATSHYSNNPKPLLQ